MTDTERLDWLERNGHGFALINDDNGHWACVGEGTQNAPLGPEAIDIETCFFIEKRDWKDTIREAIDAIVVDVDGE